jgi:hypothetical protein
MCLRAHSFQQSIISLFFDDRAGTFINSSHNGSEVKKTYT